MVHRIEEGGRRSDYSDLADGPEEARTEAAKHREHLIQAGGQPSRQLNEYKYESTEFAYLDQDILHSTRREHYCAERNYWREELESWLSFL